MALSEDTKARLAKADSALQTVKTSVNGEAVASLTGEHTTQDFSQGDNIVLSRTDEGSIQIATAKQVNFNQVNVLDGPILSSTGIDMQGDKLTNVGAGNIAAGSTDGVNGDDVYQALSNSETQYTGDNGVVVKRKPAEVLTLTGGATDASDNNIQTVADESGAIQIKLANTIRLHSTGSLSIGDTLLNNSGLTIANGPSVTSVGINAGEQRIANVAAPIQEDDAANKYYVDKLIATTSASSRTEITGTGSTVVTKQLGDNSQTIYNVYVPETIAQVDQSGNKLTKIGDVFYKASDLLEGQPINGAVPIASKDVQLKLVNPDGTTSSPTVLNNIASAISNDVEEGNESFMNSLSSMSGDKLNSAVTVGDLKNMSNAPLLFSGDKGEGNVNRFARKLGQELKIIGGAVGDLSDQNIAIVSNGNDTLTVKLVKEIKYLTCRWSR